MTRAITFSLAVALALVLGLAACGDNTTPPRTLVTRTLMPTAPQSLISDPFIGPDDDCFEAFDNFGNFVASNRTFHSASPVGGADSIEEMHGSPAAAGATRLTVAASFLGGSGTISSSLWVSAGDGSANPVPFAGAAASVVVQLLAADGTTKTLLIADPPVMFGGREWVKFETAGDVELPAGGFFEIDLTDLSLTLWLAAPDVEASALVPAASSSALRAASPRGPAIMVPQTDDDRATLVRARAHRPRRDQRPRPGDR